MAERIDAGAEIFNEVSVECAVIATALGVKYFETFAMSVEANEDKFPATRNAWVLLEWVVGDVLVDIGTKDSKAVPARAFTCDEAER